MCCTCTDTGRGRRSPCTCSLLFTGLYVWGLRTCGCAGADTRLTGCVAYCSCAVARSEFVCLCVCVFVLVACLSVTLFFVVRVCVTCFSSHRYVCLGFTCIYIYIYIYIYMYVYIYVYIYIYWDGAGCGRRINLRLSVQVRAHDSPGVLRTAYQNIHNTRTPTIDLT